MAAAAVSSVPERCHRNGIGRSLRNKYRRMTAGAIQPHSVGGVGERHRRHRVRSGHEKIRGYRRCFTASGPKRRNRGNQVSPDGLHPVDAAARVARKIGEQPIGIRVLSRERRTGFWQSRGVQAAVNQPLRPAVTSSTVDRLPRDSAIVARQTERSLGRHLLHEDFVGVRFHPENRWMTNPTRELSAVRPVREYHGRDVVRLRRSIHPDIAVEGRCRRILRQRIGDEAQEHQHDEREDSVYPANWFAFLSRNSRKPTYSCT